jgi:hypothetical protein
MDLYPFAFDSVASAQQDLTFLTQMATPQQRAVTLQNIAAIIGPVTTNVFRQGDAFCPTFWWIGNAQETIVLCQGIDSLFQGVGFANGYNFDTGTLGLEGYNNWIVSAVGILGTAVNYFGINTGKIRYVGHSAGGVLAMAAIQAARPIGTEISRTCVVTYGSPKPGRRACLNTLFLKNVKRWMIDADPVPLIPPNLNDMLAAGMSVLGVPVATWSLYGQPQGGTSCNADLSLTSAALPPIANLTPISSIGAWLFGFDTNLRNYHSLQEYALFFTRFAATASGGGDFDSTPATRQIENPAAPTGRQVTQAERRVETAIATASEIQHTFPVTIPTTAVFTAVRIGGIWTVQFGGTQISVEATKKHARAVARLGNIWLARLQTSAAVDPNTLLSIFTGYLSEATDPAGNFVPVMNTKLTIPPA